jgi:hypothetical protein
MVIPEMCYLALSISDEWLFQRRVIWLRVYLMNGYSRDVLFGSFIRYTQSQITRFWNNHSSDILKAKIFESQIIKKSLRPRKPKGLKRIAKVS